MSDDPTRSRGRGVGTCGMATLLLHIACVFFTSPASAQCQHLGRYLTHGALRTSKKVVLSEIIIWLGPIVSPKAVVVRMAEDKRDIIVDIFAKLQEGD